MEKFNVGNDSFYVMTCKELCENRDKGIISLSLFSLGQDIQRGSVWSIKKKTGLIDSILNQYAIPPIMAISKVVNGVLAFEVGDGKQRNLAIDDFINNRYELGKLMFKGKDLTGKTFSQLPKKIQEMILNAKISMLTTPYVSDNQVQEMFTRFNDGEKLRPIEKFRAKLAKELPFVAKMVNTPLFTDILKYKNNERERGADSDYALGIILDEYYDLNSDQNNKTKERFVQDLSVKFDLKDPLKKMILRKLKFLHETFANINAESKEDQQKIKKVVLAKNNRIVIYRIVQECINEGYKADYLYEFLKYYFIDEGRDYLTVAGRTSTSNKVSLAKRHDDMKAYIKPFMKKAKKLAKQS